MERFVLCGSDTKEIFIWNIECSTPILIINDHSNVVNCVVWPTKKPFSSIIISGSDDHSFKFFTNESVTKIEYSKSLVREDFQDEEFNVSSLSYDELYYSRSRSNSLFDR